MVDGVNETMKGERLSYGELLRRISLCTMMSTVAGTDRRSFWSTRGNSMTLGRQLGPC